MLLLIRLAAPGNGCSKSILLARNLTTVFCRPSRPRPSNTNKRAHTRTRSIQYSKWRFLGNESFLLDVFCSRCFSLLSVGKGGRNQDGDLIFSGSLWPPRQHCIRGKGGGREGPRRKTVVKFLAELTEADARRGYARVSGKEEEELSNSGRSP